MRHFVLVATISAAVFAITAATAAAYPVFAPSNARPEGSVPYQTKAVTFQTVGGDSVKCRSSNAYGRVQNDTEMYLQIEAYSCIHGKNACYSTYPSSRSPGTIFLPLRGPLVYLDKAKRKVGIVFSIESNELVIGCLAEQGRRVTGRIVTPITPVNQVAQSFKFKFKQKAGLQSPSLVEGGGPFTFETARIEEGEPREQSGFSWSGELTLNQPIDIAA